MTHAGAHDRSDGDAADAASGGKALAPGHWGEREVEVVEPLDIVDDVQVLDPEPDALAPHAPAPPPKAELPPAPGAGGIGLLGRVRHGLQAAIANITGPLGGSADDLPQAPAAAAPFPLAPGAPAPRPESRFLQLEAPSSVPGGRRFAITAQMLLDGTRGGAALKPLLIAQAGLDVQLDLHVEGPLQVESDATQTLRLLPQQDSEPVRFELRALATGMAQLSLRAFAGTTYLGQLQHSLAITDLPMASQMQTLRAPARVGAATGRVATLEIDVAPGRQALTFRLRGPGTIGIQRPEQLALNALLDDETAKLMAKLDQLARGASGLSDRGVDAVLRGTGADLWERLLPASVRALLLEQLGEIDTLSIIGADDPIPWELLFPTGRRSQGFISDELLVTRWAFGAPQPPRQLALGRGNFVLPLSAPPAATAEVEMIERLLGAGQRLATLDQLLDALDHADFGMLHFAAHNIVAGDQPASAYVKLDQPFQQAMLGAQFRDRFTARAPLVFMNACNSGAGSPLWVGSTSWAGRFLMAGAGAFIGSFWQVRDTPARDFAASFYSSVQKGQSLGAAMTQARAEIRQAGDPTRLAYTFFGDPDATLQEASPS